MTFITVNSSLRNNVAKECMLLIMTVGIVQFFFFICLLRLDSLMLPKSVQPSTAPQGER